MVGEEDGRLARGVAAADDDDLGAPAERRLVRRRGVVDAPPLEPVAVFDPRRRYSAPWR